MRRAEASIRSVRARAYVIPTDAPEADGTIAWKATTLVVVHVEAGNVVGLGYTYTHASAAALIAGLLAEVVAGHDAFDIPAAAVALRRRVRNLGTEGIAATAISAVDSALWDLKAKLLDLPLAGLLGQARPAVPIYGSGGFTSYDDEQLRDQLAGWVERDGCRAVKMKIGSEPARDPHRIEVARRAIGDRQLFIDANGAFSPRQALRLAETVAGQEVRWFEEPVSSDDLAGMRFVREHIGAGIDIAAGEYGYTPGYFCRMLASGAVDVLQADASRCLGITGFLHAGALADAHGVDLSGHCAPALHVAAAAALPRLRHLEWFHDHARIEAMLFDGAPVPRDGVVRPDLGRPGLGLEFRQADAEKFAIEGSA
jgi:L-alanine-DL-glutamate epimerase-like enolase superfamily enzyme